MGKGTVPGGTELYMGTAALSERDYVHDAIERADLIVTIGHDTSEKPPFIMDDDRPAGDPRRLPAGDGGAGLLSAGRGGGRHGPLALPARRPAGGQAAERRRAAAAARRHPRAPRRPRHRGPLDAAAHRPRRAPGDAGRRHRRPRQRHVQDLVRAQLPHPRRQHAAARQRAGDHGRRPALGDHGGDALSRSGACSRSAATAAS